MVLLRLERIAIIFRIATYESYNSIICRIKRFSFQYSFNGYFKRQWLALIFQNAIFLATHFRFRLLNLRRTLIPRFYYLLFLAILNNKNKILYVHSNNILENHKAWKYKLLLKVLFPLNQNYGTNLYL